MLKKPGLLLWVEPDQESVLLGWVKQHKALLSRFCLVAAGSWGQRLAQETGLTVETVESSTDLREQISDEATHAVIALVGDATDPADLTQWVIRCRDANVPLALTLATAQVLIRHLSSQRLGYLIFNPVAGQGNEMQQLALVRQRLSAGIQLQVLLTQPDRGGKALAEEALAAQPDLIIASGGDGTVSAVAGVLFGSGIPLGILPRGTANAFATAMGIPAGLEAACDLILAGPTRVVDGARCNEDPMILLAGIGFEAETVERASRELKNRFGSLAYLVSGLQQLGDQQPFQVRFGVDGSEPNTLQARALTVANAAPATSVLAQGKGRVNPEDGQLDITLMQAEQDPKNPTSVSQTFLQQIQTVGDMVHLLGSSLASQVPQIEGMLTLKAAQIWIETTPPQKVVVDGQIIGTTPVEIAIIPNGLVVIAPPVQQPQALEHLVIFWVKRVSPSLTMLTATVGVGGLVGSALALWGLDMAFEGFRASSQTVDRGLLLLLRRASPMGDPLALLGWSLGHPMVLIGLLAVGFGLLWRAKERQRAWGVVMAGLGAAVIAMVLKPTFSRIRPDLWDPIVVESTVLGSGYSFPSGRLIGATVVYGLLGYLLAHSFPAQRRWIIWGGLGILGLIGLSRAYLGLNWPSDLLAGYSLGAVWLITCITMFRLQKIRASNKDP